MKIRRARTDDAQQMTAIYNQAINGDGIATADVEPVSIETRIKLIEGRDRRHPIFVFEADDQSILGYSSLSIFALLPSNTTIAEIAVYVDEHQRKHNVGGYLLAHLIAVAEKIGFHSLGALVFEKNVVSLYGCGLGGFRRLGLIRDATFLRGRYEAVVVLQKELGGQEVERILNYQEIVRDSIDSWDQ